MSIYFLAAMCAILGATCLSYSRDDGVRHALDRKMYLLAGLMLLALSMQTVCVQLEGDK